MIKSITTSFKDIDEKQGIVTGYFAHFGSRDSDGDVIERGAFLKSIEEHGPQSKQPRIKHLLDHDTKKAVGVIQVLKEDSKGLYYESRAGKHALGQDFLLMALDGIISEHSIGYSVVKYRSESDEVKKESTWYLEELKLWEGSSLQCWGANPNTPIEGVKEQAFENIAERMQTLERAIRNGKYSDEAFKCLEIELISIKNTLQLMDGYKRPASQATNETKQPEQPKTIFEQLL